MCVCAFCFVFHFLCVSVSIHARSRKSPRQQVSHHIAAADKRMQTAATKKKAENSRNAEEWVQGQKVYIAQIDGMTHVWGPVSELHSLCREASRIGALQYSCACLFNHIWRRLQAAVRDSQNRWIGLWSSHGIPCFLLRSDTPPFL